jgi:YidC/Oxa1 family membrane protein insertase
LGHLGVGGALPATAAVLSYVTQRYVVAPNTVLDAVPEAMVRAHQVMPVLSAVGLLVAAGFVPVALLVYWVVNSSWSLGQAAVVTRWFPTPGSPAAARRS